MKRIFSLKVMISVAVLLLIGLYSCKDNPVIPPEEPFGLDSARFEWDIDTLSGYGILDNCLYAIDTNDVFLLNIYQEYLLNIKGNEKIYYHFNDFYSTCLSGIGNEIYIGGARINSLNQYVPHIKKFNNGVFQDIYLPEPDTLELDYIKYIYINHSGEMWILTHYYFIKLEGNTFDYYEIPLPENSILIRGQILKDQYNSLKAFGWEARWEGKNLKEYSYIFEFRDDHWERIWQNTWHPSTEKLFRMSVLNNHILSSDNNIVFEFDGKNFISVTNMNIPSVSIGTIAGNSYDDFIFTGYIPHIGPLVMHWNGNKSSMEFLNPHYESIPYKLSNDKYWIILNDRDWSIILIFKGNRK